MFHTYAFNSLVLSAMRTGAAILIMPRFELKLVMELIGKYKVTVVPVAHLVVFVRNIFIRKKMFLNHYVVFW
ncbi:hypothetical protein HID58_067390 [Brassica napus]|uniref:AMP-dependent synthetase/ligase domain-containing protein n=2 Tax=Brassica TaxID=3705 RepID=A0A3P6F7B6_BRAOL|nr:hypothetical protein HID58_067390 [Brassica napus]CAF1931659.1 unnamed protein product [Brassica napus]VDD45426.1 unnamed protein product [Brassica oleracea]